MGRNIKQPKNYPRIIDIDILTYSDKIIESKHHVLVEKPITTNLRDAELLYKIA